MKQNVLDVLMYLFDHYMEGGDTGAPPPDHESLSTELEGIGFRPDEIRQAFGWLDGLADMHESFVEQAEQRLDTGLRIFSEFEAQKIDQEAQGLLMYLEQAGILEPIARELVIDRIMALNSEQVDMEQVKWVVLMVLYNLTEHAAHVAWVENLLFDDREGSLH